MGIYTYDTSYISSRLTPPALRKIKHLAWLSVLLKPVQSLWNLIFVDYADGSTYLLYNPVTAYLKGNRVLFSNKKTYQCLINTTGNDPTNSTYWVELNSNFIGARERSLYNSQKILFEYALNKWFMVSSAPLIYIENKTVVGSPFMLGETGETSGTMAYDSQYQQFYLGETYTYQQIDFTIWVPIAIFNTLGSNVSNREKAVRSFADEYVLAGIIYNVKSY